MIFLVFLNDPYNLVFHEANKTKHNVFVMFQMPPQQTDASGGFNWKNPKQSATWENEALQDNNL